MDNKIVTARFATDDNYANVYDIYQWDYGQILRIEGLKLPNMVEIHFSLQETSGEAKTRIGVTKDGVTDVVIPDSFLENEGIGDNYKIFVWIYVADKDSGRTEYKITIHIKARAKPEISHGGQDGEMFQEAVEAVRDAAARASESEKQAEGWAHGREDLPERAEDNAMYYAGKASEDAKKTAQDRTEVERLTESNTQMQGEVAKDLEEVKKLSSQAQTSATNAALSEQKSKEAATRAETAQEGAETAEDNAELAAQKTGQDKAAVEQDKKLVQQMGQEVLDNKKAVDKTAQDFTLKAQQALADVNNAGQTQTERVQSAGTTAVENIENAQNTATRAVETAKTEAIKAVQAEGITQTGAVTAEGERQVQAVQTATQEIIADREQIAKNKTDIADLRQNKADAIVENARGTLLNIKDSANAFFEDFSVYGKSEQVQTTGKNLLNMPDIDANTPETVIECNISKDICISVQEKATVSKSVWRFMALYKNNDKQYIADASLPGVFYATSENPIVSITCRGIMITSGVYRGIMVEYGETATSYEPYTGGKPSPSPEYPQEIVSAGRLNKNTGKYEIDVKVTGKNLIPFPYPNIKEIGKTVNLKGVDYTVLQDGGVHLKGTLQDVFGLHICVIPFKEYGTIKVSDLIYYDPKNNITFFYLFKNVGKAIDMVVYPQIEVGTILTTYEPYREPQTITLSLDRPLTKWDRLEKREGVWGIARQSVREELTQYNFDTYILPSGSYPTGVYCYATKKSNAVLENQSSICTHFKNSNYAYSITNAKVGIYSDHGKVQYKYFVSDKPTVDEFKAWLVQQKEAGTPVELVYKTAEETWEPLPEEAQLALNTLHTNYPTTVVSNSEDTEMQLTYVADTKNYTDRKIEQAVSAQVQNLANLLSLMPLSTQAAMIENDTNNILDMEVQK